MPDFLLEKEFCSQYAGEVAGIDEVGRGPLAGPVVAASAVIHDKEAFLEKFSEVNDSKKISVLKRDIFFDSLINSSFISFEVSIIEVNVIDSINILQASLLAMQESFENLRNRCSSISGALIDGNQLPKNFSTPSNLVIKGDSKSYSIAVASIIAKVSRDRIMRNLAKSFPEYGWHKNAGYGTKAHLEALKRFGITEHHRKTFSPVRKFL